MIEVDVKKEVGELIETLNHVDEGFLQSIKSTAILLTETFGNGNKVLVCGNGGSAAEAQHFSDEMLGRYKKNRRPYPVVALTADSAALTCISNDFGYEEVFARQVEALGKEGDLLFAITTSGNSKNILKAVEIAKTKKMKIVGLTAPQGKLREIADISIESPSNVTARIQELHLHAIHLLSEFFEEI